MKIAGIEEAGRGPVIGPMVMCIAMLPESQHSQLKELGVKDSKLLSPLLRERLYEKLITFLTTEIIILSPQQIDATLNDPVMNLNLLEAKTSAQLIDILKPEKVILDCPSVNLESYVQDVKQFLNHNLEIIAEHKADLNHPIVSAASIIAKVTRDREIEKIKQKIKIDFGSGYPADPKTQAFIKNNHDKYDIFRTTWKTYKNIAQTKQQTSLNTFNQ